MRVSTYPSLITFNFVTKKKKKKNDGYFFHYLFDASSDLSKSAELKIFLKLFQ